jgi:predicted adenine nucleotide alpha hydrolase (AANH) superfamily ATPase
MKILLHICCGICAGGAAEQLLSEGHQVTGYFFNPNIHPATEYERRLDVAKKIADRLGFPLEPAYYKPQDWLQETIALSNEPEGGKRCEVCYSIRLKATYDYLKEHYFNSFTTTLTISPHKSAASINRLGKEIGGEKFLERDFKKQDGFKRANEIARQLELYRQDYCGCVYSMKKRP